MARKLDLYSLRDLDLMMKLRDEGASGATSAELARALGMTEEGEPQSVAARAAWMRRFGIFELDEKTKMWTLSEGGERVVQAKLKAAEQRTIDSVPDASMVDVMAHVTARFRLGDPVLATMLRREFQFGTSPRSTIWRAQ